MNKKKKSKTILENVITREASMIAVEGWYAGQVTFNKKFFGFKVPENVNVFRNGTVYSYRDTALLNSVLPGKISVWVKKNPKKIREAEILSIQALDLAKKIIAKKNIELKEALRLLKKIRIAFEKGFPGAIMIGYWIPVWGDNGLGGFDKKTLDKAYAIRKRNEKFFNTSFVAISHLLDCVKKATGWEQNILDFTTLKELEKSIKKKKIFNEKEILFRAKNELAYSQGKIIKKKELPAFLKKAGLVLSEGASKKDIKEIVGAVANKGIAKGIVRIVLNRSELDKVNKGDILVAPMTTPWYMPALQKAAAIVTDEGGITSHAAIIAREMGKPCIIGTKIATKVLKDGMMVEVDANIGIVKITK